MSNRYPGLEVNLNYLEDNVRAVIKRCDKCGVKMTGIIKGFSGMPEASEAFVRGGLESIGTSRLEQLEELQKRNIDCEKMMIRTPMLSEIADVIRLTDISLNTETEVIKALNEEAVKQGKIHKVILMTDVGDLREGFWYDEEILQAAQLIEDELPNIYLTGIGTNVGCYGALEPTVETLDKLVTIAEKIETQIGRKLDIISGGASSSLMRIWDEDMPERINHLRVGGEIMLAHTNSVVYGYDESDLHNDVFCLKAEIAQIKTKPSPDGKTGKKALLDIGLADYCNTDALYPRDSRVKIERAFYDYTLIDIEDSAEEYKIGDVLTFDLSYGALVYLTKNKSVKVVFV